MTEQTEQARPSDARGDEREPMPTSGSTLEQINQDVWKVVLDEKFDPADYPVGLGGMELDYLPNKQWGVLVIARFSLAVSAEMAPEVWNEITGEAPSAELLDRVAERGFKVDVTAKEYGESTTVAVKEPTSRDILILLSGSKTDEDREKAHVLLPNTTPDDEASDEIAANMHGFLSNVFDGAKEAIARGKEAKAAEQKEHEQRPLVLFSPQERRAVDFASIGFGNLSENHGRAPLFMVIDWSEGLPKTTLAIAAPVSAGWQHLGLCKLRANGTYRGGQPVRDVDPTPQRSIVEIGHYDPQRPVPLEDLFQQIKETELLNQDGFDAADSGGA